MHERRRSTSEAQNKVYSGFVSSAKLGQSTTAWPRTRAYLMIRCRPSMTSTSRSRR